MAVRPFWIESSIEGRKSPLEGGPKSGKGEIDTTIYQREDGSITKPYQIKGRHRFKGGIHYLVTEIWYQGAKIHEHETKY